MRYLTLTEILHLYDHIISSSGGAHGVRDFGALESALSQPRLTFDQTDLYPDIVSKAAALCFSLIMNHPFVDGNKRVAFAAVYTFLRTNGLTLTADTDLTFTFVDGLYQTGRFDFDQLEPWLREHTSSD
jgi:death-on-curing protein